MHSVVLLHPSKADRWREVADELEASGLSVLPTSDPATAERLHDERAEGVLLLARGLGQEETVALAARFCRRGSTPLVVWSDLGEAGLLELIAVGATDYLVGDPEPGELRARLLGAIEHDYTLRELRRGYAAFQKLFHDSVSPMAMAVSKGRLVDANAVFLDLFGYTLEELCRLDVAALSHHEDTSTVDLFTQLEHGERSTYRATKRFVRKDGPIVWANLNVSRFLDPLTGEVRFIADLQDLTPEVESHRALARAHNRYEKLFAAVPIALLVLDLTRMRFTEVNHTAEVLLGYTRHELLTRGLADLWADRGATAEAIRGLLRGKERIEPTHQRLRRADGSILEAELTITGFDDGAGDGGAMLMLLVRDLTAQFQLEGELERLRRPGFRRSPPAPTAPPPGEGRLTILLVDDDEVILTLVAEMLERGGHHVLAALCGRQALDAARHHPGGLDLLIVDATLADPSASELGARLAERVPNLPVLVISGYLDDVLATQSSLGADTPFLSKPFTAGELLQAVDAAVAGRES